MTQYCSWTDGATLMAPDPLRARIEQAYDRAQAGQALSMVPEDRDVAPGTVFGPALGPARLITRSAGSTGRPRRILRNQGSWAASFGVMATRFGLGAQDRYAILGDLSHSLSFYALAEGLHLGAQVHLSGAHGPNAMARLLEESAASVLYATPVQLRALDLALGAERVFATVQRLFVGGGPFDGAAARALGTRFPQAEASLFYGTSETSFLTLGPANGANDDGAPAFPGADLHIAAPAGETGDLWVGGPYLASAYGAGDAASTPVQRDAVGRICLGERGIARADGRFHLLGRGAAQVTIADTAIYPAAIESWLLDQPGIGHAAVLPRPDRLRGHRLDAVICWTGGDMHALKASLRATLGTKALPARMIEVENWPLLPSGKTDRAQLRRLLDMA